MQVIRQVCTNHSGVLCGVQTAHTLQLGASMQYETNNMNNEKN